MFYNLYMWVQEYIINKVQYTTFFNYKICCPFALLKYVATVLYVWYLLAILNVRLHEMSH